MWGEGISVYNQDAFVWRGTAAAAERLWSPYELTPTHDAAAPRLVEHLCRLETLGIRAGPIQPSFCPADAVMPTASAGDGAGQLAAALGAALATSGDEVTVTVKLSRADAVVLREALVAA
jgi:hypothetical protein